MAGRGPAPKPNALDRKRGVKERVRATPPAEPVLPVPAGEWHPKAVRWWQRMATAAVASTWRQEDHDLLERGMALVHLLWGHIEAGESRDAVNVSNAVLRIETALWLNPSERARQGVKADEGKPSEVAQRRAASVSDIRSRISRDAVG
jgi:hypothetical protein